eukprot:Clim_evm5s97 gene=Clim_evmTU5s97
MAQSPKNDVFGSFFGRSIEYLISLDDSEYGQLESPWSLHWDDLLEKAKIEIPQQTLAHDDVVKGTYYHWRKTLFCLDWEDYGFVNHGAFGGTLRIAREFAWRVQERQDAQPLRFMDRELLPMLADVLRRLTKKYSCGPEQITMSENATTLLSAAIHSLVVRQSCFAGQKEPTAVVMLDCAYGSVKKMVKQAVTEATDGGREVKLFVVKTTQWTQTRRDFVANPGLPCVEDAMVRSLEATIDQINREGHKKMILVVDHITSVQGMRLPIFQMIRLVRQRFDQKDAIVLVDGAHGPGSTALSFSTSQDLEVKDPRWTPKEWSPIEKVSQSESTFMDASDADIYIGNFHKWVCTPKGAAFMYVRDQLKFQIRPQVISHGYDMGLASAFLWAGTRDYGPLLTLPLVLDFWRMFESRMGIRLPVFLQECCYKESQALANTWGTDILLHPGESDQRERAWSAMNCVRLPTRLPGHSSANVAGQEVLLKPDTVEADAQELLYSHGVECAVKTIEGKLFVRVSFYIYNVRKDYEKLADVVISLLGGKRKDTYVYGTLPSEDLRDTDIA